MVVLLHNFRVMFLKIRYMHDGWKLKTINEGKLAYSIHQMKFQIGSLINGHIVKLKSYLDYIVGNIASTKGTYNGVKSAFP
jgi:hypothetical protein